MSYKNENMKMIELHENGLDIRFRIRENGVVELADFSSQEVKKAIMEPKEDICYPAVEIHRSGTGSLNMHAYKNNINQSSVDFVYENHELKEQDGGKELEIVMVSPEKLKAVYHMRLFDGVPGSTDLDRDHQRGKRGSGADLCFFLYVSGNLQRRREALL